jgi:hypothetical protein
MFGVRATIVLIAVLAAPITLFKLTNSEPFPAVILPSGGTKLQIAGDSTTFASMTIIAFEEGGAEVRVDPRTLLDRIPVQYLGVLAGESFGQARNEKNLTVKFVDVTIGLDGHHASDDEQTAARDWMARRLTDLGLSDERLVVRHEFVTVDLADGRDTLRELVSEDVIELD